MVKIKVITKTSFNTDKQQYQAVITLILPQEDGYLVNVLRNPQICIFGEEMDKYWGASSKEGKEATKIIYRETITELEEVINMEIKEVVETLKKIYQENKQKMAISQEKVMEFILE